MKSSEIDIPTRCTSCGLVIDKWRIDTPDVVIGISPLSLRKGVFHSDCYDDLIDDSKGRPSTDPQYSTRYEQYLRKAL